MPQKLVTHTEDVCKDTKSLQPKLFRLSSPWRCKQNYQHIQQLNHDEPTVGPSTLPRYRHDYCFCKNSKTLENLNCILN